MVLQVRTDKQVHVGFGGYSLLLLLRLAQPCHMRSACRSYPTWKQPGFAPCRRFNARANNRGWRLDHFLVSQALHERVHECYLLPGVMGSDHCPLGLVLKLD